MTNMNNNEGIPSRCWCGKGIVTYVSKTEEIPYRRFFRCEIGIQRKKEEHLFKWVDEALFNEIHRMDDHQARITEEIKDLRSSMKKTVEEEVMKQKSSLHVGCVGSILSILCLWSKYD
ncbi:hypothetical protein F2Q68_00044725 [Brassica cretica]|uniref:GRF-type domain-containing protein n=2 Tax=Brassica cretica TaxID=69181 RepID=A0ABQ7AUV4_BRACR|nr:hypothetical protein F2Q68_00044725 [Brassica cretica]KAF3517768.1 hypothetical protein DY000_02061080 [Brassica cretica]